MDTSRMSAIVNAEDGATTRRNAPVRRLRVNAKERTKEKDGVEKVTGVRAAKKIGVRPEKEIGANEAKGRAAKDGEREKEAKDEVSRE